MKCGKGGPYWGRRSVLPPITKRKLSEPGKGSGGGESAQVERVSFHSSRSSPLSFESSALAHDLDVPAHLILIALSLRASKLHRCC